jgi:pilus assembly protein Flp/PilA
VAKFLSRFMKDEGGATAIEYAMILAGVFLIMISAVTAFGNRVTEIMQFVSDTIVSAH